MKLGITSYAFRYLLMDARRAPALSAILEMTRSHGLERLQICENGRPLELPGEQWNDLLRQSREIGLEIQLGCKTLSLETLARYIELAVDTPSRTLRIVLEDDSQPPPTRSVLERFMERAIREVERFSVRLAIENYFAIPSRVLAEVVAPYPSACVGFCIDSANSLRKFEPPEYVMGQLGSRTTCYHIKDFKVSGDNLGFAVTGAPLGKGDLNLDGILDAMFAREPAPVIFLENWVPATGQWDVDVGEDDRWLRESLANLRSRLLARGK